jgi:hypothetical protein
MRQYTELDKIKMDKLIVAPQIVVYKNIFKNSKELIELLEVDKEDSIFDPWRQWYQQGFRKDVVFDLNKKYTDTQESLYLKDVCDIVNFIRKDYFDDFEKDKGVWPSFINNWEDLKKPQDVFYLDYFRYVKEQNHYSDKNLLMEYHVDEFPVVNEAKTRRHVLTINFYLNNEYSGGEISAYDSISNKSYTYKPQPGDAVVMPSTEPFYHAVKGFEGSDRYFLRSFIDYRMDSEEEWVSKYRLSYAGRDKEVQQHEDDYVSNDLQMITVSSAEEVIVGD